MLINLDNGDTINAELGDNGTLDTVVYIDGMEQIFDMETAAEYRTENGGFTKSGFIKFVKEIVIPACY